jgi:transcriptional regulator with XRE-family HTH domain
MDARTDFKLLQTRLIALMKARVRSGELTERSLARITGISQPHIHNVLKGARLLSLEMADQVLRRLRVDLADLLAAGEALEPAHEPPREPQAHPTVPVLHGAIGPGHPFPAATGKGYPFPWTELERIESPVAARLAPDPGLADLFDDAALVLLDRSESRRKDPDEDGYYAIDLDGESAIRRVRREGRFLYLLASNSMEDSQACQAVSLDDHSLLRVIRGRVSLVVRRL